jgi:hypothetical protein
MNGNRSNGLVYMGKLNWIYSRENIKGEL